MSGGEKARLVLALIVWQKPNLLLLDEPTNHLDLATREALAMALNEFEGTVLLVSHDRALLRSTCDDFWLVGAGEVKNFAGDLDDYQRYLLDHAKAVREAAKLEGQNAAPKAADGLSNKERLELEKKQRQAKLELARPLKKELQTLDKTLEALGAEQQNLHALLAANPAPDAIAQAGKRLAAVDAELEAAELRWLEVGEQLQALET
jgi:ATP-binding cassette subfamily F protein 3